MHHHTLTADSRLRANSQRGRWVTRGTLCILGLWVVSAGVVHGVDLFERHTQEILDQVAETVEPVPLVTSQITARWKPLQSSDENVTAVIKTDAGQLAKVQFTWGFRKSQGRPQPVLVLDRYVTYEAGRGSSAIAHGRNVMLFPGFQFDFDIGQVVPAEHGADIELTAKGELKTLGSAKLFPLQGSKVTVAEAQKRSGDNEAVIPADFSGTWNVDGDGRWKGTWELEAAEDGTIQGTFLSAETQGTYPIAGSLGALPQHAKMVVEFNNTQQNIDVYLWTKDKSALAGTFTMAGRQFGIYATRKVAEK